MRRFANTIFVVGASILNARAVSVSAHLESPSPMSEGLEAKVHLRGQALTAATGLLQTNASQSDLAAQNDLELGVNADLAFLEALPASNSTANQALEDQVSDLFKLSSLRNSMTKEQFEATPFGKSVKKIMKLIEGVMMPKVLEAHNANQKELDNLAKDVNKCGSTKNSQIEKANKKKALYLKFSPLHRTCRAGEAGSYTEKTTCWEEEADKKKIKELKCTAFAMVKKQMGDQTANKQIMKKGGSESDESYVNRITATVCGKCAGKGCKLLGGNDNDDKPGEEPKKCGYDPYTCGCGFQCRFDKAKDACLKATKDWEIEHKKCKAADKQYNEKKKECDSLQDQTDDAACKRAVQTKDACESYEECFFDKKKSYHSLEKMVKAEEVDRKAEWKGLKRMKCLIGAFGNKKVTDGEVSACKKATHSTDHLIIKYPELPGLAKCVVPELYPNTALYKKVNFAPLPALAKGKQDAYQCTGLTEIATTPAAGSPKACKCTRLTLNGPYSPGPMVKCVNCLDVRRSLEKNSCPDGTKLFSPRSRSDWKTFLNSAAPLRAPNFIVDVTRPQNGCGGCARYPMNSRVSSQKTWVTADSSKWWLRGTPYSEPSGDYHANCYLDLWHAAKDENSVTFNDKGCNYHAKSYYCQAAELSVQPKRGSPRGCACKPVTLTGRYSAGALIRCVGCLRVSRSTQKNSCPAGTKLFSPRSREDWKTFLASATPLRSPNFIIDVTQPQNGCGGCTKNAMNSRNPAQATWRTTDNSPWYLRGSRYSEPNGDYHANCYLNIGSIANENSVTFNDAKCNINSNAYYCQTAKVKKKPPPPSPPPPPPPAGPPDAEAGGKYKGYKCAGGAYTGVSKQCDHFKGLTEAQCWAKCKKSASASDNKTCDKSTGLPDCVASVYDKKKKICMLHRACTRLARWPGHPGVVTKIKSSYNPSGRVWVAIKNRRCKDKAYTQPGLGLKDVTRQQCLRFCYASKSVGKKKVPQSLCIAIAFYPKAKGKNVGYCDLYDKCGKTTKAKGVMSFKRLLRVEKKSGKKGKGAKAAKNAKKKDGEVKKAGAKPDDEDDEDDEE